MARIQGQIERITYHNEDNGYSVLKLQVPGCHDLVTAVGSFVSITPGETLSLEGEWTDHPRFGRQFKVERYETTAPATLVGITKYLGSGLIKGIGPVTAKRIVERFGDQTLEVIEHEVERLQEIEGVGPYRVKQIRQAWEDQKEIREVMLFLRSHDVSAAYAVKIYKRYGSNSLRVLKENPYQLAMDISGIGFKTADRIAGRLGFPPDSPLRAEAGLLYMLFKMAEAGHVCVPEQYLLDQTAAELEIERPSLEEGLRRLEENHRVVRQPLEGEVAAWFGDHIAVYVRGFHQAETQISRRLKQRIRTPSMKRGINVDQAMDWLRARVPFKLAPLQEEAVRKALVEQQIIITGGPGTGKTTLIQAISTLYREMKGRVCLAAPTGRAAKRLHEATGQAAATIHRLLEFSPQEGGFKRNEKNPLKADLVIIDEASMIDCTLMHHFLKAVPVHATLVMVGDVDQLPSVGAGNVLQDLIDSERIAVVRLTEIFRQARRSRIVVNAHRIREGQFPITQDRAGDLADFYFIEKEDPEQAVGIVLKLCQERIPARFKLDPVEDIQVLAPMNRGAVGTQRLNAELQEVLNPQKVVLERGGRVFRLHDKVMQVRNNYDKGVFNGDLGRIRKIDLENQELQVLTDERVVAYDFSELDELMLAYAVTVHKAQGSEYPAVVIPLLMQHYVMLQRNLLYTAVTRGRKLVVVVGSKRALGLAVRNNRTQQRYSLLKARLMDLVADQRSMDDWQ